MKQPRTRTPHSFFTMTILVLLLSAHVFAQVTHGTLRGVVKDPQGAAMPGASVTIRNLQTNDRLSVTTDGTGAFEAPSVPPGRYAVTVALTGFKTTEIQP